MYIHLKYKEKIYRISLIKNIILTWTPITLDVCVLLCSIKMNDTNAWHLSNQTFFQHSIFCGLIIYHDIRGNSLLEIHVHLTCNNNISSFDKVALKWQMFKQTLRQRLICLFKLVLHAMKWRFKFPWTQFWQWLHFLYNQKPSDLVLLHFLFMQFQTLDLW